MNGDVRGANDLLYIPTSTDEFIYRNGTAPATYQDFLDLIAADDCLAGYIGDNHSAQRLPRALDQHARRPRRRAAAVQARQG